MSNIGDPCIRKLWLNKWKPNGAEKFSASAKFKFLYGHILEEVFIFLAGLAGHDVSGRQDTVSISGIKGHRDVILDGHLVDVKSASSYSFTKFKIGLTPENDSFGYRTQLGGYSKASEEDPLVRDKGRASFAVIDKQNGHIHLDTHEFKHDEISWEKSFEERKETVNNPDTIPPRGFEPVADGYKKDGEFKANGSLMLGTNCSYCSQKFNCYDNLRIFLSSNGPKFYTVVNHKPKMVEISKEDYLKQQENLDEC